MNFLFYISIFYIVYGIIGVLGYQVRIPDRFKEKSWTKEYTRKQGVSWIILGLPWLIFSLIDQEIIFSPIFGAILLIGCSIPSLVFSHLLRKEYNNKIQDE